MFTISQESVHLAKQNAIATYNRGLRLVALGKAFKKDKNLGIQEYGYYIEQQGLLVQQYARQALILAEQISIYSSCSIKLYSKAVAARSKAVRLYTQAITVYTQVTLGRYKAAKICLQLPNTPGRWKFKDSDETTEF